MRGAHGRENIHTHSAVCQPFYPSKPIMVDRREREACVGEHSFTSWFDREQRTHRTAYKQEMVNVHVKLTSPPGKKIFYVKRKQNNQTYKKAKQKQKTRAGKMAEQVEACATKSETHIVERGRQFQTSLCIHVCGFIS